MLHRYQSILFTLFFLLSGKLVQAQESKDFSIFVAPIGMFIEVYEFGAEFRVTDQFTIGPELYFQNYKKDEIFMKDTSTATGYGFRATWQFGEGKAISS